MSRNAEEGFKDYTMLYERGVHLIFLNEPLINTSVFYSTRNNLLNIDITTGNAAVDTFFKGNISIVFHTKTNDVTVTIPKSLALPSDYQSLAMAIGPFVDSIELRMYAGK